MKEHTVYVRQRPHLHTFLERVAEMFEVVIFTASQSIYAEQLLNILDPDQKIISQRVYRDSCIFSEGSYMKDLTILGRDLAKVAIIDNSPQVFSCSLKNFGILSLVLGPVSFLVYVCLCRGGKLGCCGLSSGTPNIFLGTKYLSFQCFQVFQLQVNNGIPIESWFDDPTDSELLSILPFLETLASADDVRPIIAKKFGTQG